jgi:hypothetical protein
MFGIGLLGGPLGCGLLDLLITERILTDALGYHLCPLTHVLQSLLHFLIYVFYKLEE